MLNFLDDYNLVGVTDIANRLKNAGSVKDSLKNDVENAKKVYKLSDEEGWKMLMAKIDEFRKAFTREPESYMAEPQLVGIDCGGRLAYTMLTSWIEEQKHLVENNKDYEQETTT